MDDVITTQLLDRVVSLERMVAEFRAGSRQWRLRAWVFIAIALVCALIACTHENSATATSSSSRAVQSIEASEFIVKDQEGRIRAVLGVDKDGVVGLQLYDIARHSRTLLRVGPAEGDYAGLAVQDANGVRLASLSSESDSGQIRLRGDRSMLEVYDAKGKTRVAAGLEKKSDGTGPIPALVLQDSSAAKYVAVRIMEMGPKMFMVDENRIEDTIQLGFDRDFDGYLQFSSNKKNTARAYLGIDPDTKQPTLQFYRSTGEKPNMIMALTRGNEAPVLIMNNRIVVQ